RELGNQSRRWSKSPFLAPAMKAAISCWSKMRVRALRSAGGSLSSWKPIRPPATVNDRQPPLPLLRADFMYRPFTTAAYVPSSRVGYGLGVRVIGSQLLHDCADQVLGLAGGQSLGQSRVEGVRALPDDVALLMDALCRTAVHIHHVAVEVIRELEDHEVVGA